MFNVILAPDERLKIKSKAVEAVDEKLQRFMLKMLQTMYHDGGIGLAAVQVGVHLRVLIMHINQDENFINSVKSASEDNLLRSDWKNDEASHESPIFVINPALVSKSHGLHEYNEGCLSFPEQFVKIKRPEVVEVDFLDFYGNSRKIKASGLLSTCLQHEMDHLDGITISDRSESRIRKEIILRKAEKIKKLTQKGEVT